MVILYILTGIGGAVIPYFLQREFYWDAVTASALPSLIVAILVKIIGLETTIATEIAFIFFGASFVGMVNKIIFPRYWHTAVSGVLFCFLYFHASQFFQGYGGGLGTAACIAVLVLYGIKKLPVLKIFFRKGKK